jgi:tripartite-type tricarboxylate transporter receptor subunit TctC
MNHARVLALGLLLIIAAPAAQSATGKAAAQDKYPNRPVRFVVPFAPGGPSDILSRFVGQKLGESLGETVVIDNRGSVGGIVGAEIAARSAPDGYTLLLSANSLMTINPHVYKKLPYDPVRDFEPLTQLTEGGNVVVVHPSVQAKTMGEFIALAKAQPKKFNYATTGTGNLLGIAHFRDMTGIDMVPIAYKGTGQAVVSLISGEVQFFFMNPLVAIPHTKSGKLRALAITSLTRNPALPDLPTVSESGVSGFKNVTWHSIWVPVGTPKPIASRLSTELIKIVKLPEVQTRFKDQGLTPVGSIPAEVRKHAAEESSEVAKLVKKIGYEPQ